MNGIEALQVMKEGKIVSPMYNDTRYRMVGDVIHCSKTKGKWERSWLNLCEWLGMTFEIASEYDLTFFEAMCEANKGYIVSNTAYPENEYKMKDGVLYNYEDNSIGSSTTVSGFEMRAKWRVVKEWVRE